MLVMLGGSEPSGEDGDDAVMQDNSTSNDSDLLVSLWRDLVWAFEKQPAVASTIVVALQSRPELCPKAIEPKEIGLFLKHLDCESRLDHFVGRIGSPARKVF
jgi:hypothetical protein